MLNGSNTDANQDNTEHNEALARRASERAAREAQERVNSDAERYRAQNVAKALGSRSDRLPYIKNIGDARARLADARENSRAAAARVLTAKDKISETETRRKAIASKASELEQEVARIRAAAQVGEASEEDLERLAAVQAELEAVPMDERKKLRRLESELEKRLIQAAIDFQPLYYDREDAESNVLELEARSLSAQIDGLQLQLRAVEDRVLRLNSSRKQRSSNASTLTASARNALNIARRYVHIATQEVSEDGKS